MNKAATYIGPRAMTYEKPELMSPLIAALFSQLKPDEILIVREPFRWKRVTAPASPDIESRQKNYHVINGCYESFPLESVADARGWEVVHDFNHIGVVRPLTPNRAPL